jgi:hypothetical protein
MARLASVIKQGFHPAPPEAIAGILRHLKIPDPPPDPKKAKDINILADTKPAAERSTCSASPPPQTPPWQGGEIPLR